MNRKQFLKEMGFVGLSLTAISRLNSCTKDDSLTPEDLEGSGTGECGTTKSETAGPYPTLSPDAYTRSDIKGDRSGVALAIHLTVQSVKNGCAPLENAVVDIWHCDKDGNYSQYGNSRDANFLRGRQLTDAEGMVRFDSIFPGWYRGRATHIHVHIYNNVGTSLLVTQIAFPEGDESAVVEINSSTKYGYTQGMSGYTYNAQDNVFADGYSGELATIAGDASNGYTLTHAIKV